MVPSPLRILVYSVLTVLIFLGAICIFANSDFFAGLFFLALAGVLLIINLLGFFDKITGGWSLQSAYKKTEREDGLKALCKHLKRIGLNAILAKDYPVWSSLVVVGAVRVADRNVDFVELDWWEDKKSMDAFDPEVGKTVRYGPIYRSQYRCHYVVQANVEGLEDSLEAEGKPIKKSGFLRKKIVDFKWEGKELAQILNSDAKLQSYFLSQHRPPHVEIEPSRKGRPYVRIMQKRFHHKPVSAFPTFETFEAFDRIAWHVRSIANISP